MKTYLFQELLIWLAVGLCTSVGVYCSAVMLLDMGHGISLPYQVFSAPKGFGFVEPIIVGFLMPFRKTLWITVLIIVCEMINYVSAVIDVTRSGIDEFAYFRHVYTVLPSFAFTGVLMYFAWNVIVNFVLFSTQRLKK